MAGFMAAIMQFMLFFCVLVFGVFGRYYFDTLAASKFDAVMASLLETTRHDDERVTEMSVMTSRKATTASAVEAQAQEQYGEAPATPHTGEYHTAV